MSYGGYGRGYGQQYDYSNNDRQEVPGFYGVPPPVLPPTPYIGPGGSQYYPPSAPGFLPPSSQSQVYESQSGSMGSGRQGPSANYPQYDRNQAYQSSAAPPVSRDYNRRESGDWNKAPEPRDASSGQTSGSKQTLDIDAILKDERLKNVLFSGISKATQKLEESLRAKNNPDNVKFLNEQRNVQPSQLFPSASSDGQPKPKSILKRSGEGRSDEVTDSHPEKLSVLEKTLQLLRGKTNIGLDSEPKKDVNVTRQSAALGQLSSYSDDPDEEEAHLYGERTTPQKQTSRSSVPFWSVGAAPSETEAVKRDSVNTFDLKEKLYEEWRSTINKREPEKPKTEMSQLQAFISSQMSAGASGKKQKSAPNDNEELDSTVQNILQSIGFNFDLSKRMQELAKQKKKEHDDMQTGIVDQRASFLENAKGIEDMKAQLFSEGSSSIDSFIKKARAETQSGRSSYEKHVERSRSPDVHDRKQRDRSGSRDHSSHYHSRSPERRKSSTWSSEISSDYRRLEKERRRSHSSERSTATPPRGGYGKSDSRGHRLSERFRDEPKDEYYYPDEHDAIDVPPSLPLLKPYSSQKKSEHLSSGLFPSAKRIPQNTEVENFTVLSKAVDDDDDDGGSFTGSRRIILPSKPERRVVSKSPPFKESQQSPFRKSLKRSASPLSPRQPSKERRYYDSRDYDYPEKPKWDDSKYDMKITTFRDMSPENENIRYQSPSMPYDNRDEQDSQREFPTREPSYDRMYPPESKRGYEYEKQWGDGRGSQERDKYHSPKRYKSRSPGFKNKRSPQRYKQPGWDKNRSPQRERARSPPRRRSPERGRSPGRRRSPSPGRRRSPHRKPYNDYKQDSRSKSGGRSFRGNKNYSSRAPFDKNRYHLDNRKRNAQDKSKAAQQAPKEDLSKMSDSERKAYLMKLIAEKEKAAEQAKTQASTPSEETSKVDVPKKVLDVKSVKSSKPETSSPAVEKPKTTDVSQMTPEERKAHLAKVISGKMKTETDTSEQLNTSLLTAIERLSTLSMEARKEILLQMARMTGKEREEAINNLSMRQIKVTTLKKHLEKLKKEQNELMRKSRRSGLGNQDPQLLQNSEEQDCTQAEIDRLSAFDPKNPFEEIDMSPPPSHGSKEKLPLQKKKGKTEEKPKTEVLKVSSQGTMAKARVLKPKDESKSHLDENWKVITDTDTNEITDLGVPSKKASKSDRSTNKDGEDEKEKGQSSSSSSLAFGSNQAKVYYEYVDGGNHWCKFCHIKCNGIDQLFEHLHGKKHLMNSQKEKKPWKDSKTEKKFKPQKVGRACTRRIKGSEMLFPVIGFYCSLCKQTIFDQTDAADHLKSDSHYNKYLDYIKVNPGYEKKLLLERTSIIQVKREESPEAQPPPPPREPPPTAPPPPPPPPPPKIIKTKDKDKSKKQLRKSGKDASSDSEDESVDFGADNTNVEDMDLDEEEDLEAVREAKSKVPKLSGKDPSKGPAAAATLIQSSDNMKENKEDQDKPLSQFLSIAEGSDLSKLPVVPPKIDLNTIPIPTGPPTLSELPAEQDNKVTVKSQEDHMKDEEKRIMGIDVDAQEEQPLKAIPVPPPQHRKETTDSSNEGTQKTPKSLDTLFSKVSSKLANKKVFAGKTVPSDNTPNEMELRIQQEIDEKVLKEKMKITQKKLKAERAKKPEEPRKKKKIYSDSSSDDSDAESDEEAEHSIVNTGTGEAQMQHLENLSEVPMPPGLSASEYEDEQNMMFQGGLIVLSEVSEDKEDGNEPSSDNDGEEDDEPFAFTLAGSKALRALIAASASNEEGKDGEPVSVCTSQIKKKKTPKPKTGSQPGAEDAPKTGHIPEPLSEIEKESARTDEPTHLPPSGVKITVTEVEEAATAELSAASPSEVENVIILKSTEALSLEVKDTVAEEPLAFPSLEREDTTVGPSAMALSKGEEKTIVQPPAVLETENTPVVEATIVSSSGDGNGIVMETAIVPSLPSEEVCPTTSLNDLASVLDSEEDKAVVETAPMNPPERETVTYVVDTSCSLMEVESSTSEPTANSAHEIDESGVAQPSRNLPTEVDDTPTILTSPPVLSEAENTTPSVEEIQQDQLKVGKRGRGRGKRGSASGRGRGRKSVQQQDLDVDNQHSISAELSDSLSLSASVDTQGSEPVDQSPGKRRGRGRRGQATKRACVTRRVTRSRGAKNEDITEQEIHSPNQDESSQADRNESNELIHSETLDTKESIHIEKSQAMEKEPYSFTQAETSQVAEKETHELRASEDSRIEEEKAPEFIQVETSTAAIEENDELPSQTDKFSEKNALEMIPAESSQVEEEEAHELIQAENTAVETGEAHKENQVETSEESLESIQVESSQGEVREAHEYVNVEASKVEQSSEVSMEEAENPYQAGHVPTQANIPQVEMEETLNTRNSFDHTETSMISEPEIENITSEAIASDSEPEAENNVREASVSSPARNILLKAGQDNAITSASDIDFCQDAFDINTMSAEQNIVAETQEEAGVPKLVDTIDDQSLGLQYQVFEQPQSPDDDETDSDATITDDVDVQPAVMQIDDMDAAVQHDAPSGPVASDSLSGHEVLSSVPLEGGFHSTENTSKMDSGALSMQPMTACGIPGMDPPMSAVISEMDESIDAVTYADEGGLLDGVDESAPSAGLSLDLEADESMYFTSTMKDREAST